MLTILAIDCRRPIVRYGESVGRKECRVELFSRSWIEALGSLRVGAGQCSVAENDPVSLSQLRT